MKGSTRCNATATEVVETEMETGAAVGVVTAADLVDEAATEVTAVEGGAAEVAEDTEGTAAVCQRAALVGAATTSPRGSRARVGDDAVSP
jgi:hypothetical protein